MQNTGNYLVTGGIFSVDLRMVPLANSRIFWPVQPRFRPTQPAGEIIIKRSGPFGGRLLLLIKPMKFSVLLTSAFR
jgi:hypothetical protein